REKSGGKLTLDDYMKLLWLRHGKPGGSAPGLVGKPYSVNDLREHLATLTGDHKFATEFFEKYVKGREAPDFARLLALAGYNMQMAPSGKGWIGTANVAETPVGLSVGGPRRDPVPFHTPLYDAGIDSGDTIKTIDGEPATMTAWNAIANRKAGDKVT